MILLPLPQKHTCISITKCVCNTLKCVWVCRMSSPALRLGCPVGTITEPPSIPLIPRILFIYSPVPACTTQPNKYLWPICEALWLFFFRGVHCWAMPVAERWIYRWREVDVCSWVLGFWCKVFSSFYWHERPMSFANLLLANICMMGWLGRSGG